MRVPTIAWAGGAAAAPAVLPRLLAALALIGLCAAGCGVPVPDIETDPSAGAGTAGGPPAGAPADTATDASGSLVRTRSARVQTAFDTYIVRNVSFDTGEGFGSSQALMGFTNNTLWEYQIRFVESVEVFGTITAAEAQTAPQNYLVRDDPELRRTFRTRLRKTDGEVVDFIVRINDIRGTLETGGSLLLSRDELETLRRIEFF